LPYGRNWPEARCHAAFRRTAPYFGLLSDLERIVALDAEIAHGAFELDVAEKQLEKRTLADFSERPVLPGMAGIWRAVW
jgi:hypothetical protein